MDVSVNHMTRRRWKDASITDRHEGFNEIHIVHPHFARALALLGTRLRMREYKGAAMGFLLVCPPNGGKTSFMNYLRRMYPPVETEDRSLHPLIGFSIPNPCNPLGLSNAILEDLGDPDAEGSGARKQIRRANEMIEKAGVKILAVDNMQDVPERRGMKGVQIIGNFFRDVIDCNVVPVFLGTQEAIVVVRSNDQLRRRVPATLSLGIYDIMSPKGLSTCLRIVDRFDDECPLERKSSVARTWMGKAIAYGSNGTLGGISGLFRYAMTACVDEGLELLQLRHWHQAFNQLYAGFEDFNPFVEGQHKWRRLDRPGEPFFLVKA